MPRSLDFSASTAAGARRSSDPVRWSRPNRNMRQLGRLAGDHDGSSPSASTAGRGRRCRRRSSGSPRVRRPASRTPCRRGRALEQDRRCSRSVSSRGSHPGGRGGCPRGARSTRGVLSSRSSCGTAIGDQRGGPPRTRSTSAVKSWSPSRSAERSREPVQLRDHDRGRAERVTLADEQVDHEVLDRPARRRAWARPRRPRGPSCTARRARCATSAPCADPRVARARSLSACGMSGPTPRVGPVVTMTTERSRTTEPLSRPPRGSTLLGGLPRARCRHPARALGLHPLHARQRALRCPDRRRRLGARLVDRPRACCRRSRPGRPRPAALVAILALFVGVAILRAVGIVARRLGAGVMQYRMQAAYRREVTRQYLTLPMSWHQQHPTGELLSNANSDVEAAWAPIAPLPMAVGTLAMMMIAIAQMLFTDMVMAAGRAARLPARDGRQRRLPAAVLADLHPHPGACAPS